ncbi:hypothetical protein E4U60_000618 [Claviceps pazoutovae]|uniref:Uncharacterized protein n=1 Tax=Claviceps pazoutovae TaxID=1649127 RepID=A0A9P7MKC2_9HYPO|nr:hypothetical protein E4U60_000618 [Claviceps pazoutovae]
MDRCSWLEHGGNVTRVVNGQLKCCYYSLKAMCDMKKTIISSYSQIKSLHTAIAQTANYLCIKIRIITYLDSAK